MFNQKAIKVDPQELKWGQEIEMEHTDDPEEAKKIALDHLKESPKYYTYLKKMEKIMPKAKKGDAKMKKISKKTNPFAVCHTTVDKEKNPEKYEKCVLDVKGENKKSFNLKSLKIKKANIFKNNRVDSRTRNIINKELQQLTTPGGRTEYYDEIPIDEIFNIVESQGLTLLQEDNTRWSGFLLGDNSSTTFTLGDLGSEKEDGWGKTYEPIENALIALQWHKMDNGRYEINAYIS